MKSKWLRPYEGRLHKGNPLKRIYGTVEEAVRDTRDELGRAGTRVAHEAERVAGDTDKFIDAAGAALSDPKAWLASIPTFGASFFVSGKEAFDEMTDDEQAEEVAAQKAEYNRGQEAKLVEDERIAQEEQAKLVEERDTKAKTVAQDRAKRLGAGRRGLLYQGKSGSATGKNEMLGG